MVMELKPGMRVRVDGEICDIIEGSVVHVNKFGQVAISFLAVVWPEQLEVIPEETNQRIQEFPESR